MSEQPSDERSESANQSEVFASLATLRNQAQEHRAAYHQSVDEMNELCEQLRDVELLISGRLYGRGGTRVHYNDPDALVERLHVRVGSAYINTYEGHGELVAKHVPFVDITAWTIEGDEMINAQLGIGEFGVSAEIVDPRPVQV